VTSEGTVVQITSAGREAIVAQLHRADEQVGFELPIYKTLQAFESAGATGCVRLRGRDDAAVLDAIRNLAERTGGERHLEPGIANLHRTLVEELNARWAEEQAQSVENQVSAWFRERGLLLTFAENWLDDWWVYVQPIDDPGLEPARYAQGSSPGKAALKARERYEQEH
jgi:hypothetical protein